MCGNVFPGDTVAGVLSAFEGPIADWAKLLRARGWKDPLGLGLFLGSNAATELSEAQSKLGQLQKLVKEQQIAIWTANAFPFGGFHEAQVKQGAFLPDWRHPDRLSFTHNVAQIMSSHFAGELLPRTTTQASAKCAPVDGLSISTCPLGYGPAAGGSPATIKNLRAMQEFLRDLERQSGVPIHLALEPEPDGCCERVEQLCKWLGENVLSEVAPIDRRIGVCWDLCHSAVVGESCHEVTSALSNWRVPLVKVQISSALQLSGGLDRASCNQLGHLTKDRYLHQVRGQLKNGSDFAVKDLPDLLDDAQLQAQVESLRVHCHVPVNSQQFAGNLRPTDWVSGLQAAWAYGCRNYELETYTLPILPEEFLGKGGQVSTMVSEMEACAKELAKCSLSA